jgi:hypothetical protein
LLILKRYNLKFEYVSMMDLMKWIEKKKNSTVIYIIIAMITVRDIVDAPSRLMKYIF